ncbi:pentapeptide repeat-containing protein, partial [Snodgrassella alvi]
CKLNGAFLLNANLQGVNLSGADLFNANFNGSNLKGGNVNAIRINEASFIGAIYDKYTIWPKYFLPATKGAILQQIP